MHRLKVLDHATTGPEGADNCAKFVEILGTRNDYMNMSI